MPDALLWLTFSVFAVASVALAVYGLHLYVLVYLFRRRASRKRADQKRIIESYQASKHWPAVTSQIPIYNESDVAERVIQAVAAIDYPTECHEIQILDDSTDHTCDIVNGAVARLRAKGFNIHAVRRPTRDGYKAGALAHGLAIAQGTYVAVFDADFVPPADFLRRAVPLLEASPDLACLQGRWDHLNRDESWLTKAQALGIDGHFAVEQGARAWNGLMMNFNGTAGIWRKSAIDAPGVGGWSGDTLTEDLDLSYRAQLGGWRIEYCLDLPCPAELPGTITALKSQQRRWATGSIQVARKLLPRIWRSNRTFGTKVEATLHLTHYSVAVWMLLLALVARPMLLVISDGRIFNSHWFWLGWSFIILSAFAPSAVYAYARYSLGGRWSGLGTIPYLLALGCGLCLNNSIAVIRGLRLWGGEFVRTPKSGSAGQKVARSSYAVAQDNMWFLELLLGAYSMASFLIYFRDNNRVFSVFLLIYAIGFWVTGWSSRPRKAQRQSPTINGFPAAYGTLGASVETAEGPAA